MKASPRHDDETYLPLFDSRFVGANWRDPASRSVAHNASLAKHEAMVADAIRRGNR